MEICNDKIFSNDPLYMRSLVGMKVKLETIENVSHTGKVYVIDPIFKTVVLHTDKDEEGKFETIFILYHAIKSFEVLSKEADKSYLETIGKIECSDTTGTKKQLLKKWLQHMFINVEERGNYLKIDDHLLIVPPYGTENCICNNTIILERIRNIINLMPPDFTPN